MCADWGNKFAVATVADQRPQLSEINRQLFWVPRSTYEQSCKSHRMSHFNVSELAPAVKHFHRVCTTSPARKQHDIRRRTPLQAPLSGMRRRCQRADAAAKLKRKPEGNLGDLNGLRNWPTPPPLL